MVYVVFGFVISFQLKGKYKKAEKPTDCKTRESPSYPNKNDTYNVYTLKFKVLKTDVQNVDKQN
ncbi:hypothetical protein D1818_16620 [Aquimarina sp. BL5]|nr:hypothetical protein D1818_16620 [Aquimarina sp. BL5]RKN10299.1 hypothetical protein D7036_03000 [Aquimarina sp. BL5]